MAGDWMPVRLDLSEDPAVVSMALSLDVHESVVVGALVMVWSWWSRQSSDGRAKVTLAYLDRRAGRDGFAREMLRTKWMRDNADGTYSIPRWDRWMSKSAKKRLNAARRQARSRSRTKRDIGHAHVTRARDKNVTREEKRREEKSTEEKKTTTTLPGADAPAPVKTEKAPRKKPVGDHAGLIDYFVSSYERLLGTKYVVTAKDGVAAARLLKSFALLDLQQRAHLWLTTTDPWISGTDRSMSLFAAKINTPCLRGVNAQPNSNLAVAARFLAARGSPDGEHPERDQGRGLHGGCLPDGEADP